MTQPPNVSVNPLTAIKHALKALLPAVDLPQTHTAIVLHWPEATSVHQRCDQCFIFPGILREEPLHHRLDALIEEHVTCDEAVCDVAITEVTVFWHLPSGEWTSEELRSEYHCSAMRSE